MKTINSYEAAVPAPSADVVARIKYLIDSSRHTQAAFANLVGVDPANLSRILSGKMKASDSFLNRLVVNLGVSKEWLSTGYGIPYPREASPGVPAPAPSRPAGAPVYNIDVTAGCIPLARMFTDERIIGWLDLPNLDPNYPVVQVTGDSMIPRIQPGSLISIRPVSLRSPLAWGQIYVVVLEDYRLVKFVRRHPDSNKVILHSANSEYDDMEINRDDIQGLYLVEAIMSCDLVG